MMLQLFRNLFGARAVSRVELLPDRVWISAEARSNGMRKDLKEKSASGAALIALVAHFPDVHAELERLAAEYAESMSVRAILARQLSTAAAAGLPLGAADVVDLLVAERHPLSARDDELVRFAEALPCRCRIVHHLSLDDALLRFMGIESLRTLLDRLGATEDEPIMHNLVTRSIQRAQQKIDARSTDRYDADSAGAWLERNTRR